MTYGTYQSCALTWCSWDAEKISGLNCGCWFHFLDDLAPVSLAGPGTHADIPAASCLILGAGVWMNLCAAISEVTLWLLVQGIVRLEPPAADTWWLNPVFLQGEALAFYVR